MIAFEITLKTPLTNYILTLDGGPKVFHHLNMEIQFRLNFALEYKPTTE